MNAMTQKNSKDDGIDRYHDMDFEADKASQLKQIYADWAATYDQDNDDDQGQFPLLEKRPLYKYKLQNFNISFLNKSTAGSINNHCPF